MNSLSIQTFHTTLLYHLLSHGFTGNCFHDRKTAKTVRGAHFSDPVYFHSGTYYEVDYVYPDETQRVKVCTETTEGVCLLC